MAQHRVKRWLPVAAAAFALAAGGEQLSAQQWPATPPSTPPADWGPVSINLDEIPYPYPVKYFDLVRYDQPMRLAYMDVAPVGTPNGQTVVIFHGMNFYGEAYGATTKALSEAGFRVIVPDQIGYGKSSKPIVPYDFNFKVANTKALLDSLDIERVAVVGHSMGGAVVSRWGMVYPDITTHVVMVNQIALTDQRIGRPWREPRASISNDNNATYQGILRNHQTYYPTWHPPHLEYVRRQYGQTLSGDWPNYAMVRALQSAMLYKDPVVYDWQHIKAKTLVMGGAQDGLTPDWDVLARGVSETVPNATLLLYPGIGHNPQTEIPDRFHADLIRFLRSDPAQPADQWQ